MAFIEDMIWVIPQLIFRCIRWIYLSSLLDTVYSDIVRIRCDYPFRALSYFRTSQSSAINEHGGTT